MICTILGAGETIGEALKQEFTKRALPNTTVRMVRRTSSVSNDPLFENIGSDILDAKFVNNAVRGSDIVFLLAGLPYNFKTWQSQWHIVMQNAIDACTEHKAKLIFFDNVYMYGKINGRMTEETPFNHCSKKGEVRAHIAQMLLDAIESKKITGMIARAADFYGPNTPLSMFTALVVENALKGKSPQALVRTDAKHSFTFTPDCGRALLDLALDSSAYNQTWHLPTYKPALTAQEMSDAFLKLIPSEKRKMQVLSKTILSILGLFVPILRELKEMLYQYDSEYYFDSTKFEKHFGYRATNYEVGLEQTATYYKAKQKNELQIALD